MSEISIGQDVVNIKAATIVKITEHLMLVTEKGPVDLIVDISADLGTIPSDYHEVFINMLMAKYLNKVSFGHNPFSKCIPPNKKKWWQIWK